MSNGRLREFDIEGYRGREELGRTFTCFPSRSYVLGFITDSLGYITREEVGQVAQQFYTDAIAGKPRPIGKILQEAGLARESKELHYLRSFLGRFDQAVSNVLRSTVGHDLIMSHVALEYHKEEMEQEPDLTPPGPDVLCRSVAYWADGNGPIRPVMMDFFQAVSHRLVDVLKIDGQEIILPTFNMGEMAGSLEAIIKLDPVILKRNLLLVVGELGARVIIKN